MKKRREDIMWLVLGIVATVAIVFIAICIAENMMIRRGAKKTLTRMETIYLGAHEYIPADCHNFSGLDIGFYDETAAVLQKENFVQAGDVENLTATNAFPCMRTFIRNLISDDGITSAGLYYINPRGLSGLFIKLLLRFKSRGYVDFETELRCFKTVQSPDGQEQREESSVFITTSNADMAAKMKQPSQFDSCYLPSDTPVKTVLKNHLERVETIRKNLNADSGDYLMKFKSLQDILDLQNRMELLKAEYRRQIGLINQDEIRALGDGKDKEADRFYQAIIEEREKRDKS